MRQRKNGDGFSQRIPFDRNTQSAEGALARVRHSADGNEIPVNCPRENGH